MKIIGITGGIACGKSTVTNALKIYDIDIIDADVVAHEIIESNKKVIGDIVNAFGKIVLLGTEINRKALGKIIFENPEQRKTLDDIMIPVIKSEIESRLRKSTKDIVVLDVPLLIEVGWHKNCDAVWVIYLDRETQIERLMKRNNLTEQEAIARIDSQMPLDEKVKYADVVLSTWNNIGFTERIAQETLEEYAIKNNLNIGGLKWL